MRIQINPLPQSAVWAPDLERVEAAARELGITDPILLKPYARAGTRTLGNLERSDDRWVINLNVAPRPTRYYGYSFTLWHELGHAQDLGRQMAETGRPFEHFLTEVGMHIRALQMVAGSDGETYAALYNQLPWEQYANKIAEEHAEVELGRRIG